MIQEIIQRVRHSQNGVFRPHLPLCHSPKRDMKLWHETKKIFLYVWLSKHITFRGFSKHFLPPVNGVKKLSLNSVLKTQFIIRNFFSLLQSILPRKNVYKDKKHP